MTIESHETTLIQSIKNAAVQFLATNEECPVVIVIPLKRAQEIPVQFREAWNGITLLASEELPEQCVQCLARMTC